MRLVGVVGCVGSRGVRGMLMARLSELKHSALRILRTVRVLGRGGMSMFVRGCGVRALAPRKRVGPVDRFLVAVLTRMTQVRHGAVERHITDNCRGFHDGNNGMKQGIKCAGDSRTVERRCTRRLELLGEKCSLQGASGLAKADVGALQGLARLAWFACRG